VLIAAGIVGAAAGASVSDSWLSGVLGGFFVGIVLAVIAILFGGFDLRPH
jgi:hypothetical protein